MAKILTPQERRAIVACAHRDHFGGGGTMTRMALNVMPGWIDELAASHEALERKLEERHQLCALGVLAKHADPTRLAYLAIFNRGDAYHASITTLKGILLDVMSNVDWCEIVELLADNENEYGLPSTWDAPTN